MRHLLFAFLLSSCVTVGKDQPAEPPVLTTDMSPAELSDAGIQFGEKTLQDAKKLIEQRKSWPEAHKHVEKRLRAQSASLSEPEVINALSLYQVERRSVDPALVVQLLNDDRVFVRQAAWRLAARFPSAEMGRTIEQYTTRALVSGGEERLLLPEMADAARAHDLHGLYTLMRRGLMASGDPAFAEAMRAFDSQAAAKDFLDYLGRADMEDLRQLHQRSVNVATCLVILQHLASRPLEVTHPKAESLFMFAVSRNQALQEYASIVLEKNLPAHQESLATILARLPVWVQVAYVENSRRHASPNMNLFMDQLKLVSAHREVVEEIEAAY